MTGGDPTTWSFYIALSLFRGAAILAGVRARAMQGNASSANAHEMGHLVDIFAKRALLVVKGVNVPRGISELSHRSTATSATAVGFEPSAKAAALLKKLTHFMHAHVYKAEEELEAHAITPERWNVSPVVESLKQAAKRAGLWNLWLPLDSAALLKIHPNDGEESSLFAGPGLTNLEYAHLAEVMGASVWASEAFNCSAPDTGNMEVLLRYGSAEQQERWLRPLLTGEVRSCFAMTEPAVASSDATNIESAIERDGSDYILNGRKW
jgi:acyl-CoA dehydrogenase